MYQWSNKLTNPTNILLEKLHKSKKEQKSNRKFKEEVGRLGASAASDSRNSHISSKFWCWPRRVGCCPPKSHEQIEITRTNNCNLEQYPIPVLVRQVQDRKNKNIPENYLTLINSGRSENSGRSAKKFVATSIYFYELVGINEDIQPSRKTSSVIETFGKPSQCHKRRQKK